MALAAITRTVLDASGNATAGGSVEIRSEASGVLAVLYSDRAGASPIGNPFTAGAAQFTAYMSPGRYRVDITVAGNTATERDIVAFDDVISGVVIQSQRAIYTANTSITTIIPQDDTVPLISEGTEVLSLSITPSQTSSLLRCRFFGFGSSGTGVINLVAAMFRDSTCVNAVTTTVPTANYVMPISMQITDAPATTSAVTISVRVGPGAAATIRLNGSPAGRLFGGAAAATLTVEEIAG